MKLLIPLFDSVELYDNTDIFQTVYERNGLKTVTFKTSIEWAKASISADKQAVKIKKFALQQHKENRKGE
ncbi:hypothetical protein ERK19_05005 [Lactobacillus helsingborgensis]|uniref:hypothetical protein n=1 Tax=Lactobacillus helsingborgensis TaxID=1218494 RepID=UPI001650BCC9|nr:hypothetical protein [Lactobacillus helsingborgensis]MBC6356709.1 hypothetical protein [Lactobacillus helsingborgensis]